MNKKYSLLLMVFLSTITFGFAQLSAGDIAFVQYNADGVDNFAFVALVDVADTETIYFTDNEENDLSGGEGTITWTPPAGGITCGTVVTITTAPSATVGSVTETGDLNFSVNGDSILAYQGTTAAPTFLAALSNDGGSWGGAADGNLPPGLTNGTTAIAISPEVDNCALDIANPTTDTQANLLATINDNSNWTLISNAPPQQSFTDTVVVTDCSTTTRVEFVSATSTIVENGVSIDVCVEIANPDANPSSVQIELDPSSTATNGADFDDGAVAFTFPETLNFPSNDGSDQCFTIFMVDDIFYEGDETIVLNLINPSGGNAISLGPTTQHVVTIQENEPYVPAEVMITEIMYNSVGVDDEWIEICNLSGVDHILNGYEVQVNGVTQYTFPASGVQLADGDCLLVELGDNGDANFNPGCVFNTPYSSGLGSGVLSNSSATITIVSDLGATIDSVFYDDAHGADGNGSSLHFNTNASDNSNTGVDWQEVSDAGSPGINSLISPCGVAAPDINVANNSFNNIPDNSPAQTVPYNTIFAARPISTTSAPKIYYITNEGNQDLVVQSITLDVGTNFSLQNLPALPLTITPTDPPVAFEVVFNPVSPIGVKTDIVRINNTDPDVAEADYNFEVEGEAECAASSISISPTSGPAGTVITVIGTNLSTASATFNGLPAALVTNISSTEMEVTVPSGASSGSLEVLDDSNCTVTTPFTVIDNQISSCQGGSALTEIFISEVTDATYGSLTYIELYNPTSSDIVLTGNYEIRVYSNGSNGTEIPSSSANPAPSVEPLTGTILAGQTFVLTTGTFGALGNNLCSVPGGDGTLGDQVSTTIAGVNITSGGHDFIGLYETGVAVSDPPIDAFGGFADDAWMDALGTPITGTRGFNFRRLNTATPLPNPVFDETQWNIIDWAGQGDTACVSNNVYVPNIGQYDFSTGTPPINIMGATTTATFCDVSATITASGDEGVPLGPSIAYQWYVFAPGDPMGWQEVSNGGVYSGATSGTLNISDTFGLDNYQYYCQIREDTATCYSASDAVRLITQSATWVSPGVWLNGVVPDINSTTIIDFNYDTSVNGSFSACSLNINSGTLQIANGDYVEIQNDLVINGTLDIATEGSLIMIDNLGTVTNNGTTNVHKTTTDMETFDYTYWSSPVDYSVSGTNAQTVLTGFRPNSIFSFNTSLFFDILDADGNAGADGFDDDQNAWTFHNNFLASGLGYAAMSSGTGVHQRTVTFSGLLNTGIIPVTVALSQNGADANDDWNLLGNPYPSAIFVDEFIAHNSNLSGTVYLWTHEDDISISNPGPNYYNFSSNDYAMYNSVGGIGTASTGTVVSNIPTGYIASGQGFFVEAISAGNVEFTNDMRGRTYNNNDFFRNSQANSALTYQEKDRMWLNLTNPDGAFSQILIGYLEDGTLGKDRLYDGIRLNGSNYIDFYSKDDTNMFKYGIQGRPPFSLNDVIPLGYDSNILGELTIALYRAEGVLTDTTVYLKDYELNTIHNLSDSEYTFTTEDGSFSDRFEIVFQSEALSVNDNVIDSNELSIIELQNGHVKFSVGKNLTIETITIMDLLGRTLYNLQGNNGTEVFELNNLSQSAYIAKVELSNGQTIVKRALKQK